MRILPALVLVISCPLFGQDLGSPDVTPFSLTGNLITAAENYSIPGLQTQRPVNTARLYFNPTLTLYDVQLPFSFMLSTQERSYNQPFNQFGVSPRYKWLTLHAGYRSLRFSEFTLSDVMVLGGGAEVRGDWFHAGAMYGRFRRPVDEDTLAGVLPVYRRMGWAATMGFGSAANFIDLNVLHGWDDSTSLSRPPVRSRALPEENVNLSLAGRWTMLDGRIAFDAEIAGSFYTRDRTQPSLKDPAVTAISSGLIDPKLSTRFNMAEKIGASYNEEEYGIRLEFARVDPEYETMGATYTQNDRQDITVAPSLRLFEGTLRASGSVGFRRDNLYDDRGYTTNRVISSASLNWSPTIAFGIDGQYSNYSMSNTAAAFALNDTTRVENVTNSFSLAPRYLISGEGVQHFMMLLVTRQAYDDRNVVNGRLGNNDVLTAMANYIVTFQSGINVSGALQYTEAHTSFVSNIIRGVTVALGSPFFENALNAQISYSLNLTQESVGSATDTQHLVTLGAAYRLSQLDVFDFRFQYNIYDASNPARRSYAGSQTRLQYTRAFAFGGK